MARTVTVVRPALVARTIDASDPLAVGPAGAAMWESFADTHRHFGSGR